MCAKTRHAIVIRKRVTQIEWLRDASVCDFLSFNAYASEMARSPVSVSPLLYGWSGGLVGWK